MGEIKKPVPEKLVSGFIFSDAAVYEKAKKEMEKKFGPADYESPEIDFNFTEYYGAEMGRGLKRRFVSFGTLVDPGALADAKLFSDRVEKKFLSPGLPAGLSAAAHSAKAEASAKAGTKNRKINIDPGLISHSKLVLATTKNFAHRIYLGKGIYAEVTLQYKNKRWNTLDWTYPDYASAGYMEIMTKIRSIYSGQVDSSGKL